jgi:hypothetical protein
MESRALDSNATTPEDLALLQLVDIAVMEYSEELGIECRTKGNLELCR